MPLRLSCSQGVEMSEPLEEVPDGKKKLAVSMLLRGKSRDEVASKLDLSTAEVFRIEEEHYRNTETLDEHAMYLKQMRRMEMILDALWDQLIDHGTRAMDPDDLKGALALIGEMNEIIGLKKTRVETEVKIIQEQQTELIFGYVQAVLEEYTRRVSQYLTAKGKRELEAHQVDWVMEATHEPVAMLDAKTELVV